MPTKKQRRRQAKTKRHEYEYVLLDEEGHEVPVDPAELRAQKEKERDGKPAAAKGKQQPAARDRRGRVLREPRKPTWSRAIKMGLIFVVALFVFTSYVGKTHPPLASRIGLAAAYGVLGIPFFYWMDRMTYRRWERTTGRTPQSKPKPKKGDKD